MTTSSQDHNSYETDWDDDPSENDEAREMLISSGLLPASHFYGDDLGDEYDDNWMDLDRD